ncbi:MAG: hypothetical protein EZS28_005448 [Streblomastix strix]|uniref:Uncharacterized protein n=1 Tax=Streblomastix strix TaxID=222440 RepID=A0A5J4WVP6_9EUKA|nr:MAG: hypothetical protein EZS28_005448 [Streblomastix strix]
MITITIIDMIRNETAGTISQIWEEVGREKEKFQVKVQKINKTMNIGLQALPPVQTVTGAPVYMSSLRTAQEEAFRKANDISPNLDEESSVSRTSPESINYERDTPLANFQIAQQ